MKERFNQLISETIKPLLKEERFVKKGLNFFKQKDDLIFLLNFQNSQGNTGAQIRFYINCCIHSTTIDKVIGRVQNTAPREYECYFRKRISDVAGTQTDGYIINGETDMQALETTVVKDLKKATSFFNQIFSCKDLVNLMIRKNGLNNYQELFEYLLIKEEQASLKQYTDQLYQTFGKEKRWNIFENNLNNLILKYQYKESVAEILGNVDFIAEDEK